MVNRVSLMPHILLLLVLSLLSFSVFAEVARYVAGAAPVKMRSDVGEKALIISTLTPGAKVTELQRSPDGVYSRVRLASGMEGWVPGRSLAVTAPAGGRSAAGQTPLSVAMTPAVGVEPPEAHIQRLSQELSEAQQQLAFLREAAAKPKQLEQDNVRLHAEMVAMQNDMRLLKEQNLLLQDSSGKEGFVIGAIVFFAGLVFGMILPRLMPRKQSMWKEL